MNYKSLETAKGTPITDVLKRVTSINPYENIKNIYVYKAKGTNIEYEVRHTCVFL